MKKAILLLPFLSMSVFAGTFEAGFARLDITPPLGVPLSGNYTYRPAEFVHDPLEATCVAFSDGTTTALVYTVDNLHITDDVIARAWDAIANATGVKRDTVFIASTHTHNGPATSQGQISGQKCTDAERANAHRLIAEANDMLVARLAEAGRLACADLSPANMSAARGKCPGISFIRLFRMKDGRTRTNPGVNNPDIDCPIGTPDETLQLVRIAREGKKEIAIVNFQTHPAVIGRRGISADWPGSARRNIEQARGGNVLCAFFNGAQGDTNHINVHPSPGSETVSGYPHSLKMGRKVADAALAVWDDCQPIPAGRVSGRVRKVRTAANVPDPESMPEAKRIYAAHMAGRKEEIPFTGMDYITVVAEAKRMVDLEHGPATFELPVSTIAIGEGLAFAGFPGEPFTELGRSLKTRSRFRVTVPCCLVNGSRGYLPTSEVYAYGGYEARNSRFKPGVGEILRDALAEDLESLYVNASSSSPFEAKRAEMLNRPRTVIWNTDGNDMVLYPRSLPLTPEAFESVRLKYTEGTKIDSVFYCPHASAFGWFTTRKTHDFMTAQFRPPEAEVYNAAEDFAKKGTDALEMASAYCCRQGLEIFVSIRMNDTHDNRGPMPPNSHFSLFKQQHPECLMGTMTNRPRYCAWTAVDFVHEAVRAHVRRFVREFFENYDVDGIEYDFFRHLQLFKSVADGNDATKAELDMMTGLMRELRAIAEEAGRRRGKPFLVAVRVPDSVDMCRTVGIDIERWMRERLVDIVIGSGYFQCNPWHVMAEVVHKHGCKFYASLDEPRNAGKRAPLGMLPGRSFSKPFYMAREAAAMTDGADGVYFYNLERKPLTMIASLDPRHPGGRPQNYFAVPRATAFSQLMHYCAAGDRFLNMPKIDPQRPLKLAAGETYSFDMVVGDDPAAYVPAPCVTVDVLTDAKDGPDDALALSVNGTAAERMARTKGVFSFAVPAKNVKKGANAIAITAAGPLRIADFVLRINKPHDKGEKHED